MYVHSVSTSNSKEAFCMVYQTFLGQFQPSFSISGPGDGFFKKTLRRVFDYSWPSCIAMPPMMPPDAKRR